MKLLPSPPSLWSIEKEREREEGISAFCFSLFAGRFLLRAPHSKDLLVPGLPVGPLSSSRDNRARNSGKFRIISLFFCATHGVALNPTD